MTPGRDDAAGLVDALAERIIRLPGAAVSYREQRLAERLGFLLCALAKVDEPAIRRELAAAG